MPGVHMEFAYHGLDTLFGNGWFFIRPHNISRLCWISRFPIHRQTRQKCPEKAFGSEHACGWLQQSLGTSFLGMFRHRRSVAYLCNYLPNAHAGGDGHTYTGLNVQPSFDKRSQFWLALVQANWCEHIGDPNYTGRCEQHRHEANEVLSRHRMWEVLNMYMSHPRTAEDSTLQARQKGGVALDVLHPKHLGTARHYGACSCGSMDPNNHKENLSKHRQACSMLLKGEAFCDHHVCSGLVHGRGRYECTKFGTGVQSGRTVVLCRWTLRSATLSHAVCGLGDLANHLTLQGWLWDLLTNVSWETVHRCT